MIYERMKDIRTYFDNTQKELEYFKDIVINKDNTKKK